MKKKFLSIILTGALLITAGSLTGCGKSKDTSSENDHLNQADSLTIGVLNTQVPSLVDEYYAFTAKEVGDEVSVTYQSFTVGNDAITALVNGDLDIVFGLGSLPIVSTASNGFEYEIISYYGVMDSCYMIASDESGITDVSSLAGHTVGVTFGTAAHMWLLEELENAGLTLDDITLVNVEAASAQSAIASGDLDAALLLSFQAAPLISSGDAVLVSKQDESPSWVIANKDYATNNPAIISSYLTALNKTGQYIDENKETVISEVAAANDIDEALLQETIDSLVSYDFFSVGDDFSVTQLEEAYQFSVEQELIDREFNIGDYINASYAK